MSNRPETAGDQGNNSRRDTGADTQTLIGLLENLVPLLLHFQSQSLGATGSARLGGNHGAQIEQHAAVTFTEDIILDAVRNLSSYLQNNAGRYPGLDTYTGVVGNARRALAARDYHGALSLVFDAYRAITIIRAIRPDLPPIRQRGQDEENINSAGSVH